MEKILKTGRLFFLLLFFFFFSQKTILAKDYKVDYVVENQDWTYDYFFNYMFALCSRLGNL